MGFLKRRKIKNAGVYILEQAAAGNARATEILEPRYADGVTDDDLIGWFAYSDKQRDAMMEAHHAFLAAIYLQQRDEGASEEAATEYAHRHYPNFLAPEKISAVSGNLTGEDRPLPEELLPRFSAWVQKIGPQMLAEGHVGDHYFTTGYSSANARVRAEIAKGNL